MRIILHPVNLVNPVKDWISFDAIDQVTGVNYTGGTASTRSVNYNYDATGNRTSVVDNGVSTAYQSNSLNAYTSVGGAAMVNDLNGNLLNGGTIQSGLFFYDAQNRLTKATVGTNTMEFFYDSKNRVVKRSLNGTNTYLVYDGWSLIEERTNGGTLSARYVHGAMIDEVLARITTTSPTYYHHDGLGSTTMLTNAAGAIVEKYSYDIFGKATIFNSQLSILNSSAYANRFMFTGREYLKEVGLYDYRNRVYSQELGRFLQKDPIGFLGGDINLYRYVGNKPNWYADPSGLRGYSGPCTCEQKLKGYKNSNVVDCDYGGSMSACLDAKLGAGWSAWLGGGAGAGMGLAFGSGGPASVGGGMLGVLMAALFECTKYRCCPP